MCGLRILACLAVLLVGMPAAYAQGTSCADLEEIVAELEATTIRNRTLNSTQTAMLEEARAKLDQLQETDANCLVDLEERIAELEATTRSAPVQSTDGDPAVQQVQYDQPTIDGRQDPDPIQYDQPSQPWVFGDGYHHSTVVEIDDDALTIYDVWSQTEISFSYNHVNYYNAPSLTFGVRDDNGEPAFILRDDPESDCGKAVGQVRWGPGRAFAQGRYWRGRSQQGD